MNRILVSLCIVLALGACRHAAVSATADRVAPLAAEPPVDDVVVRACELSWETRPSGVQVAVLYGDPDAVGPFGLRLRYPPGYTKEPHYHPCDAHVTVLSGAYHRGYGNAFDRASAIHLTAGTYSHNPALVSHYEWVEEPAELEVHATGPWGTVYVAPDGTAREAGQLRAVSQDVRPPTVLRPERLRWHDRGNGDEIAVLFGDPRAPGPFVLRVRSVAGAREEPHYHPRDARVTVLSGQVMFGIGRRFDAAATIPVDRGSVLHVDAGVGHYKWNRGSSLVEVHATGPWDSIAF